MKADGTTWARERGEHAWSRDPSAAEVAAGLEKHEAVCAERWNQILGRMGRMETIVIGAASSMLLGMGGIIWTLLAKGIHP